MLLSAGCVDWESAGLTILLTTARPNLGGFPSIFMACSGGGYYQLLSDTV